MNMNHIELMGMLIFFFLIDIIRAIINTYKVTLKPTTQSQKNEYIKVHNNGDVREDRVTFFIILKVRHEYSDIISYSFFYLYRSSRS